ncbi:MAG: response regulator [Myxococcaceae bacterium]|jgi:signal transduction histidine kinase|nr:response regulator [Myxococcaceae bacterium]
MLKWLERLGAVHSEPDLELRRQGRIVSSIVVVATLCAGLLAITYQLLGSSPDAVVGVVASLGGVAVLVLWRVTRSVRAATHLTLAWFLATFVSATLLTQALAYLGWLSVLPLVAFFIGGLRAGLAWSLTVLAALVATGVALMVLPLDFSVPGTPLVRTLRVASLPPVIAALGLLFELSRVRSATEMENARAEAIQASEAKGRLLAKVSHEIRTPLNGVLGLTQSLLLEPLPERAHQDLELIRQSGAGLLALINDLLDVARAESGKLELQLGPVDLGRLLRDVVALHQPSIGIKPVALVLEGLPERPLWVRTDEVRLRQVLNNLVSNAVKFTDAGTVTVRLTLGRVGGGLQECAVTVEDTGRGMSAEGLGRLFQPFTQLHPELSHLGSGLGLSIAKELSVRLGGTLSAASTEGRGSLFSLLLVLEHCEAPQAVSALPPLPPFVVMVVDDNALNRRVARALLERLGGQVVEANDGQQAVDALGSQRVDLVLMDLQMPVLDGLGATRRLREDRFTAPIVGLTASAGPDTAEACRAAGMNGCLSKPVQLAALHLELARVLVAQGRAA